MLRTISPDLRKAMVKRDKQSGFSFFELVVAIFIIIILMAVVILATQGFFGKAQERAWEADLRIMNTAVDAYMIQSLKAPTADGKLPPPGEYAPIDFDASFTQEGKTLTFYPDFIKKLPRHSDEGVWRLDSASRLSIDMDLEEY
jgi:type II secretory pathway pseudopilin PulG